MSTKKDYTQLQKHKVASIAKLEKFIDSLINSKKPKDPGRADKLMYWIEDYTRLLKKEQTFDSTKLIKYKRGDIVKVHLGYRLGSEEGGLHFGIVLDVNNSKKSDTVTIVPLTSYKEGKRVHPSSVYLKNEVFLSVISKHDKLKNSIDEELKSCSEKIDSFKGDSATVGDFYEIKQRIDDLTNKSNELKEIRNSIIKMKSGSVALINQITTISKLRIYDPMYSSNVLYGIRLSDTSMDLIDEKITELYTGNSKARK